MTPFDVALARLLLAAVGSLAAGAAVWAVALLCARRLPLLAQQRSTWLPGQALVALVFAALLLPHSERLRIVPVIEIRESAPPPAAAAPAPAAGPVPAGAPAPAVAPAHQHAWLRDAARAWLVLYLLGLGHALVRWRRARRLLEALAAGGQPLAGGHAGFAGQVPAARPAVVEVDAPIAPMLYGLFKPRLLLPHHLRGFDPLQQRLIVEHELTHWRRRDLAWSAAASALQVLFWFNPFMRKLRARLGWAQEFGCDRDVLRGRPPAERRAYAAALVAQLKLQHQPAGMALAFGAGAGAADAHAPTLAARIERIRTPATENGSLARGIAFGSLAAVALANLALQPALGWQAAGVPDGHTHGLAGTWPGREVTGPAAADCLIMVDAATGAPLVRDGTCDVHVTPASTFKIAISLMGFDSGVLRDAHAPYLPYKASYEAGNPSTRHDTDPAAWLRESVVWYSQQVVGRLGADTVRRYVRAFGYGNRDLASVPGVDDAVALSEVSPTLRISPREQTVFLRKLVNRSLPLSAHAYDMTARLLQLDAPVNGWEVHGKTGTAPVQRADGSTDGTQDYGWYVGWAVKDGRTLVFARLLQNPSGRAPYGGMRARATLLRELAQRAP